MGAGNSALARPSAIELVASMLLFDHVVGAAEQREWHREPKRLGGLEVDDQLRPRDLLDRQVAL